MRIAISTLFLIAASVLYCQHPQIGSWRFYCNSKDYQEVIAADNHLFVNAKHNLYDLDWKKNYEWIQYDHTNELADFDFATMAYNPVDKFLLIAYKNTMVDIMSWGNKKYVTANYDLYNKILVADKSINSIKFIDSNAYLSTNIGIVVLDYYKNEIRNSYFIGPNGNQISVFSLEVFKDSIFASTLWGIYSASFKSNVNLQNYSNWKLNPIFGTDSFIKSINDNKSSMYWMSERQLIQYNGNRVSTIIPYDTLHKLITIRYLNNALYILLNNYDANKKFLNFQIQKYENNQLSLFYQSDHSYKDIAQDDNKQIYLVGNELYKLQNNKPETVYINIYPLDYPFRIQTYQDINYVNMGVMYRNLDATLNKGGMFTYNNMSWSHQGIWSSELKNCTNQLSVINRFDGQYKAYVRGGVSFEKNGKIIVYDSSNSPIGGVGSDARVSDMQYNPIDSSIWLTSNSSKIPLISIDKNGKWRTHDLSSQITSNEFFKIVIDEGGNKWLLSRNKGLILFNEKDINNPNDDIIRTITGFEDKQSNCSIDLTVTNDATLDRMGNLWVASSQGIGVISSCTYDASYECDYYIPILQIITPNDTNRYTECAFLNTNITALAVDGGNNLWVGTSNGIFYTDDGSNPTGNIIEMIRLNSLNSPLSAKSIYDIAINPKLGEVLISTEIGLLGYMGQSTESEFTQTPQLVVFPNPVPRDFNGLIGIDGLPDNSYYKITDALGNLMYQGKSNGSRVTWDGRTLNGNHVPTGVYYIFAGKKNLVGDTKTGKMTIIR